MGTTILHDIRVSKLTCTSISLLSHHIHENQLIMLLRRGPCRKQNNIFLITSNKVPNTAFTTTIAVPAFVKPSESQCRKIFSWLKTSINLHNYITSSKLLL